MGIKRRAVGGLILHFFFPTNALRFAGFVGVALNL
jgi:hypothetical protein